MQLRRVSIVITFALFYSLMASASSLDSLYGNHAVSTKNGALIVQTIAYTEGRALHCDTNLTIGKGSIVEEPTKKADAAHEAVSYPVNSFDPNSKTTIETEQILIKSGIERNACAIYTAEIFADRGSWNRERDVSTYNFSGKIARSVLTKGFKTVELNERIELRNLSGGKIEISVERSGDEGNFSAVWQFSK